MRTAGQLLQTARQDRKLDLTDASRATRIRPDFLSSIEADDYNHLPNATVAKGFIRNYSVFLGLNPNLTLAAFRRDFIENEQGRIVPRGAVDPVGRTSLWTPRSTIIALVVFIFTLFGGYLAYQFWLLRGPPYLQLASPAVDQSTTASTLEVAGRTDPEATITVNEQLVTLDRGGEFFVRVPLSPGSNRLVVVATGKSGRQTRIVRYIFLTTSPSSD